MMNIKKLRVKAPMKWRIIMGIVVGVALVVVMVFWGVSKKKAVPGTVVTPKIDTRGREFEAGNAASPEYNQKLRESDAAKAATAEKKGNTHLPTVIGIAEKEQAENLLDEIEKELEMPNAKEDPIEIRVKQKVKRNLNERELKQQKLNEERKLRAEEKEYDRFRNLYAAAISNAMEDVGRKFVIPGHNVQVYDVRLKSRPQPIKSILKQAETIPPILKAGDLIYCQNELELNSDVPSPVVLTTIHGIEGKFFGKFTKHQKHLLLELDRFVDAQGQVHTINAYAVDPATPRAAIRSRVDNRYFTRWASLIATSFLDGWGEAVESSGSTVTETIGVGGGLVTSQRPEYDSEEQAWIATGKVAEALSVEAKKYFKREETVYLDANTPIGVLIVRGAT